MPWATLFWAVNTIAVGDHEYEWTFIVSPTYCIEINTWYILFGDLLHGSCKFDSITTDRPTVVKYLYVAVPCKAMCSQRLDTCFHVLCAPNCGHTKFCTKKSIMIYIKKHIMICKSAFDSEKVHLRRKIHLDLPQYMTCDQTPRKSQYCQVMAVIKQQSESCYIIFASNNILIYEFI